MPPILKINLKLSIDDRSVDDGASSEVYTYTNNNWGRPVLVTKDGVQVAAYTYDDDEQRIEKSLPDGTLVHYAYDSEGRLISETNGATGDTIREYLWLGLTPIAVIAANDNGVCNDQARIDELTALIADKTTRITANSTRISELGGLITNKQARIANNAARIADLSGLITDKQTRIAANGVRIAELGDLVADKQTRIGNNEAAIVTHETRIGELETILAGVDPADTDRIAHLQTAI